MGILDQPPPEFAASLLQTATVGTSERWRSAKLAETYYESKQYVGLRDWNAQGALSKKKPREILPFYKTCINTMKRFVWGGSRFPRVTIGATRQDDEKAGDDEVGPLLFDEEADDLTTFVVNLIKCARLDRCAMEYTQRALITTSAAVIVGTRGGYLTYYVEPGYHCTPTFDPDNPRRVKKLEIVYQYQAEVATASSTVQSKLFWFRRIIDDLQDVVFLPEEVHSNVQPDWKVDAAKSAKHGLGFCPVTWVKTFPVNANSVDGQPFIDPALYPLLDRINYVYSQRGRAVEYGLDPQWIRKNVSKSSREDLQKNPGKIWDVEDTDKEKKADIALVEATGTGSETAGIHLQDMTARFLEAVGVVLSQSDKVTGAISGVVLEYLHAPMIAVASDLRKDLGDDGFGDLINLTLRIVTSQVLAGFDIWIPGAKKAADLMKKAQLGGVWLDFPVRLQWGRYFSPTAQDVQFAVQAATQAKTGSLVAESSATRYVSDYFGVVDIDAERDQIDSEQADAQKQDLMMVKAQMPVVAPAVPTDKQNAAKQPSTKAKKPNRPGKA